MARQQSSAALPSSIRTMPRSSLNGERAGCRQRRRGGDRAFPAGESRLTRKCWTRIIIWGWLCSAREKERRRSRFADGGDARPKEAEPLTNLGLAMVQTGAREGAVPLYLRAAKLTPKNATIYEDLGAAYLQENNVDDAIREFQTGLKFAPRTRTFITISASGTS